MGNKIITSDDGVETIDDIPPGYEEEYQRRRNNLTVKLSEKTVLCIDVDFPFEPNKTNKTNEDK